MVFARFLMQFAIGDLFVLFWRILENPVQIRKMLPKTLQNARNRLKNMSKRVKKHVNNRKSRQKRCNCAARLRAARLERRSFRRAAHRARDGESASPPISTCSLSWRRSPRTTHRVTNWGLSETPHANSRAQRNS